MVSHARDRKTWLLVQSHGYEERSLEFFEELIQVTEPSEVVQVLLESSRRSPHLLDCAYQVFAPLLSVEKPREDHSPPRTRPRSRRPAPQRQSSIPSQLSPPSEPEEPAPELSSEEKVVNGGPPTQRCLTFLHDPFMARGLRQFLKQQHCEENFSFWRSVESFREEFIRLTSPYRSAMRIYERYINGPRAPELVSLNHPTKKRIQAILTEAHESDHSDQYITETLFDEAQKEIIEAIDGNWFSRFKKDARYIGAVAEQQRVADISKATHIQLREQINESWTAKEWAILLSAASRTQYRKGDYVMQRSTFAPFLYLLEGGELSFWFGRPDGDQHRQRISTPGTLIGELTVFRGAQRCLHTVQVESDIAFVYQISLAYLYSYLRCHPANGARFFYQLGAHVGMVMKRLIDEPEGADYTKQDYPLLQVPLETDLMWDPSPHDREAFPELVTTPVLLREIHAVMSIGGRKGSLMVLMVTGSNLYYLTSVRESPPVVKGILPINSLVFPKPSPADKPTLSLLSGQRKFKWEFEQLSQRDNLERLLRSLSPAYRAIDRDQPDGWEPSFRQSDWLELMNEPPAAYQDFMACASFSQGDVILGQGEMHRMIAMVVVGSCSAMSEEGGTICMDIGVGDVGGLVELFVPGRQLLTLRSREECVKVFFVNNDFLRKRLFVEEPTRALRIFYSLLHTLNTTVVRALTSHLK